MCAGQSMCWAVHVHCTCVVQCINTTRVEGYQSRRKAVLCVWAFVYFMYWAVYVCSWWIGLPIVVHWQLTELSQLLPQHIIIIHQLHGSKH